MKKRIVTISTCIVVLVAFCFSFAFSASASTISANAVGIIPTFAGEGWTYYKTLDQLQLFWGDKDDYNVYGTHVINNADLPKTYAVTLSDNPVRLWVEVDLRDNTNNFVVVNSGQELQVQMYLYFTLRDVNMRQYFIPYENITTQIILDNGEVIEGEYTASVGSDVTGYYDSDVYSFNIRYINNSGKNMTVNTVRFGVLQSSDGYQVGFGEPLDRMWLRMQMMRYRLRDSSGQVLGAEIAGAIGEQTDILTNGWDANPITPDGSQDLTDFENLEQSALDSTSAGLSDGLSFLNGLGPVFGRYANSFGFVRGVFNVVTSVGWVNDLLSISLAIGFVAIILGLTSTISSAIRKK